MNIVKKNGAEVKLTSEPVPIEEYPIRVERSEVLHHLWQLAQEQRIVSIERGQVRWA